MKLQLNKKKLKNLSKDAQILPSDMTPNIGGAGTNVTRWCTIDRESIHCNSDMGDCGLNTLNCKIDIP